MNALTGLRSCVTSQHTKNKVKVVSKDEIRKSSDMHWLRIDRYYSSEDTFAGDREKKDTVPGMAKYTELQIASANPQVAFQPVMCQHCNHAPCETVCPVAATSQDRKSVV